MINTRLTDGEGALLVDVTSTSGIVLHQGGMVAELGQIQVRFRLLDAAPSVANVSQDVEGNDSHWDFSVSSLSLANFLLYNLIQLNICFFFVILTAPVRV